MRYFFANGVTGASKRPCTYWSGSAAPAADAEKLPLVHSDAALAEGKDGLAAAEPQN